MKNTRNQTNLLSTDPGNLKREKIRTIPITLIDSANVHPFQVKEDDELLRVDRATYPAEVWGYGA